MSGDVLAGAAGMLLSLAFAYLPGLRSKYDAQTPEVKAAVMAVALIVVALVVFGLACANWFDLGVSCDQPGAEGLLSALLFALVANQSTYLLAVRPYKPQQPSEEYPF